MTEEKNNLKDSIEYFESTTAKVHKLIADLLETNPDKKIPIRKRPTFEINRLYKATDFIYTKYVDNQNLDTKISNYVKKKKLSATMCTFFLKYFENNENLFENDKNDFFRNCIKDWKELSIDEKAKYCKEGVTMQNKMYMGIDDIELNHISRLTSKETFDNEKNIISEKNRAVVYETHLAAEEIVNRNENKEFKIENFIENFEDFTNHKNECQDEYEEKCQKENQDENQIENQDEFSIETSEKGAIEQEDKNKENTYEMNEQENINEINIKEINEKENFKEIKNIKKKKRLSKNIEKDIKKIKLNYNTKECKNLNQKHKSSRKEIESFETNEIEDFDSCSSINESNKPVHKYKYKRKNKICSLKFFDETGLYYGENNKKNEQAIKELHKSVNDYWPKDYKVKSIILDSAITEIYQKHMKTLENKFYIEKRRKIDDFRYHEKKRKFNTNDLITKNKFDIENVRKTSQNICDNYKKNINMGHDKKNYYKTKNDTNKEILLVDRNKFSKNNLVEDNSELKELVFNKNNKDENFKDGIKLINIRKNMKLLRTEKERISKQKRNDDIEKLNVNTELNKITQENLCTEETKIEKTEKKNKKRNFDITERKDFLNQETYEPEIFYKRLTKPEIRRLEKKKIMKEKKLIRNKLRLEKEEAKNKIREEKKRNKKEKKLLDEKQKKIERYNEIKSIITKNDSTKANINRRDNFNFRNFYITKNKNCKNNETNETDNTISNNKFNEIEMLDDKNFEKETNCINIKNQIELRNIKENSIKDDTYKNREVSIFLDDNLNNTKKISIKDNNIKNIEKAPILDENFDFKIVNQKKNKKFEKQKKNIEPLSSFLGHFTFK